MTDQSRVELLVAEWEQARDRGAPLTPEQVCAQVPHLLPALVDALLKRYPHLDDTRERTASDTDARTTRKAPPEPLPAAVGEYAVLRELGRGGMGRVYEADDPHLRRRVAIKVMKPELAADPLARERFLREARAQAAVQHDHVAVIHDVKQDTDGTPFLVLPLLSGETLAGRLARQGGPLPVAEVVRIGRQIADGLAAAHVKGLIHRDVKPANVWLDSAGGQVRVLDFGLARAVADRDDPTLTPDGAGRPCTPAYAAPEQAGGRAMDARSDLFSLGAVLFELATGTRAFRGRTVVEVLGAVATHTPPPAHALNRAVPEPLSELIAALLNKEPTDRTPDTAAGVSAALKVLGDGRGTGTPTHLRPTPQTNRRLLWPLLVGGLVVVVSVAVLLFIPSPWRVVAVPPPSTRTDPSTTTGSAIHGSVDLLVYRVDRQGSDALVPLDHDLALPLRAGDHFKVAAEVNRPAYLYLFWTDENGNTVPMYPWVPGRWGTRPDDEKPTAKLDLVAPNGRGFKITGDANGMETILMLVRNEKLTATDGEVQGWFAGLKPLPYRGEQARVWFENFDVVRSDDKRAFEISGDVDAADGPLGLQRSLRGKVSGVDYSRAISFARVGPKNK